MTTKKVNPSDAFFVTFKHLYESKNFDKLTKLVVEHLKDVYSDLIDSANEDDKRESINQYLRDASKNNTSFENVGILDSGLYGVLKGE